MPIVSSTHRTLRGIVLGAGRMGKLHARTISSLNGVELAGVVDVDQRAGECLADIYGVNHFETLSRALDHDTVDFAVVAASTAVHRPLAEQLAERNIPALVEKPLGLSMSDTACIISAYRNADVLLSCGFPESHDPLLTIAMREFSKPNRIQFTRQSKGRENLSVLWDLMIHDVDLAFQMIPSLIGKEWRSSAFVRRDLQRSEVIVCMSGPDLKTILFSSDRDSTNSVREIALTVDFGTVRVDVAGRKMEIPHTAPASLLSRLTEAGLVRDDDDRLFRYNDRFDKISLQFMKFSRDLREHGGRFMPELAERYEAVHRFVDEIERTGDRGMWDVEADVFPEKDPTAATNISP